MRPYSWGSVFTLTLLHAGFRRFCWRLQFIWQLVDWSFVQEALEGDCVDVCGDGRTRHPALHHIMQNQPESEARVAELAVPIVEAQVGNFEPLIEHVVVTLSMFHADGDGEWLYNIPGRPVFGWVGAIFFWVGIFDRGLLCAC